MTRAAQVAVLGAGPAGAACALALVQAGIDGVVLVNASRALRRDAVAVGETIPPDTQVLFDRLGIWQDFLDEGHEPCLGSCSAWGSDDLGHNDFVLNPHGGGWHLDRARFDAFLLHRARTAGVTVIEQSQATSAWVQDAGFVVDATGRTSAFARQAGAHQRKVDRLTFVYGFFDTAQTASRSQLTLLEAARDGWWYAAALPGKRLAVAFACDAEHVRAASLAHDAHWLGAALATRHLAARLDGCRFLFGSLVSRVAASFLLDRVSGPRWLAIGDAAACYDPLAAQGIYKAIADGLDGADCIASAVAQGRDLSGDLGDAYACATRMRFDEYLANRNHFYALERRWPDSHFWQRRQARVELSAAA